MSAFFWRAVILSLTASTLATLGAACGDDDGEASGNDERVRVITTLPLFADFVREVGGDRVDVDSLLPGGADPHTWEPAPQDVAQIEDADIVFANGLDLEPAALNLIEPNLPDGVPLVELGHEAEEAGAAIREPDVDAEEEEEEGEEHEDGDPHLWMDVANAKEYARIIRDELSVIDPDVQATYAANYEAYIAELDGLDRYLQETTASIPQDNRKLITTHDAFGYLADYLRFEITAVVSENPGQDTSPGDLEAIVIAIEDAGVPAVFTEPQISGESETLEQVAEDTGAIVCTLYSDAFDDEIDSYVEMMRFNADELARCLEGS